MEDILDNLKLESNNKTENLKIAANYLVNLDKNNQRDYIELSIYQSVSKVLSTLPEKEAEYFLYRLNDIVMKYKLSEYNRVL